MSWACGTFSLFTFNREFIVHLNRNNKKQCINIILYNKGNRPNSLRPTCI